MHQLQQVLSLLDERIAAQTNAILHHPRFQALESAWRGVLYLVRTRADYDARAGIIIKVIHTTWRELARDLIRAIEFDQSQLFQRLYSDEYDMPGGQPFGVLLGNYQVSHRGHDGVSSDDVPILRAASAVASAALCPIIMGVSPRLFGIDSFADLAPTLDVAALFQQAEYNQWQTLRQEEDSRFLGLVLPTTLMRLPYWPDGSRREQIVFRETVSNASDYLWGNACFAFGGILIRAFANTGWFADIRGGEHEFGEGGVVRLLRYAPHNFDRMPNRFGSDFTQAATAVELDDRMERQLAQQGLIPLCSQGQLGVSVFYSNSSLYSPTLHAAGVMRQGTTTDIHAANSRLAAMLQYVLCAARFGHYIKMIGREKIGSVLTAQQCQTLFQRWLNEYTTASETESESLKARYPLSESRITVSAMPGRIGIMNCVIQLKPHFQLDQLISSIQIITELSVRTSASQSEV
jgi:type VI secretion system protein ImpD